MAESLMAPKIGWTREGVKRYLVQRFYTRFHMSLILASCGLSAMLTSWALLHAGVHSMLGRYPVAMCVAYLTFLCGVWAWLRYVGLAEDARSSRSSLADGGSLSDISWGGGSSGSSASGGIARGGGGSFDGGGASAAWSEGVRAPAITANLQTQALAAVSPSKSGGGGSSSFGDLGDLDGDGIALLVLAVALIAAIFVTSGWLIWFAPDILSEAAFGAVLAGGLARRSRDQDPAGWIAGVVKKTWWPFAVVLAVSIAFAWYASVHFPAARTFREAVAMALVL
ncbi:MAG: hypothetical protein IPP91_07155 [Betaproteobacteria bacterium]|nr:hypothetical protein [Betaproteobacteria bacterium]